MAPDQENNLSVPAAGISRLRALLGNPISLIGAALALVALISVLFLFLLDMMSQHSTLTWAFSPTWCRPGS